MKREIIFDIEIITDETLPFIGQPLKISSHDIYRGYNLKQLIALFNSYDKADCKITFNIRGVNY